MLKKLYIPLLFILISAIGCNKGFNQVNGNGTSVTKTMVFKASSLSSTKISLSVIRPASTTASQQLETDSQANYLGQYSFTSSKLQTGDKMSITITSAKGQSLTGSLTIDGVNIPYTDSGTNNNLDYYIWTATVN